MHTFNVVYTDHAGTKREAEVTVHETNSEWPGYTGPVFYARNLSVFGCGKKDRDPIGAVHRLVQDHGNVIAIQPR